MIQYSRMTFISTAIKINKTTTKLNQQQQQQLKGITCKNL